MTKEEIQIAQAAYCVGKMWDEYEGTDDFERLVGKRVRHLIELVRKSQPSLPSDLDEAAELSANDAMIKRQFPSVVYNTGLKCFDHSDLIKQFKAGAEWMAGQGVICEGKVVALSFTAYVKTPGINEKLKEAFSNDTEVVVQIRKK